MTDTPMALEVCLCGECAAKGHAQEKYRPLTAEEVAQREADAIAFAEQKAAEDAAIAAKEAARQSGVAKLLTLGLTQEEADVLVI